MQILAGGAARGEIIQRPFFHSASNFVAEFILHNNTKDKNSKIKEGEGPGKKKYTCVLYGIDNNERKCEGVQKKRPYREYLVFWVVLF